MQPWIDALNSVHEFIWPLVAVALLIIERRLRRLEMQTRINSIKIHDLWDHRRRLTAEEDAALRI